MNLIEMKEIKKEYKLGKIRVPALKGVDLNINHGDFSAIWGPSGSGKTTLLNILGTIDEPTSGTLIIDGEHVNSFSDNKKTSFRNDKIGFVFQSFNLIPVLSALENVMLPLQIKGVSVKKAKASALEKLQDMELETYCKHRPDNMSGGQRQRVAIARALVTNPSLIIADEPTANLDSETSDKIIRLMKETNKKYKTTFIFSTHDQRLLSHMKKRIELKDGLLSRELRKEN